MPTFHVAGLSILARSYLSGGACFSYGKKWNAEDFLLFLKEHKITLSSLVPAQVYDLVKAQIKAPSHLRAVVVGGGESQSVPLSVGAGEGLADFTFLRLNGMRLSSGHRGNGFSQAPAKPPNEASFSCESENRPAGDSDSIGKSFERFFYPLRIP